MTVSWIHYVPKTPRTISKIVAVPPVVPPTRPDSEKGADPACELCSADSAGVAIVVMAAFGDWTSRPLLLRVVTVTVDKVVLGEMKTVTVGVLGAPCVACEPGIDAKVGTNVAFCVVDCVAVDNNWGN